MQSARDAALKVCIDLDLFNKWRKAGKTQSANQLAELSGTEPLLMGKWSFTQVKLVQGS